MTWPQEPLSAVAGEVRTGPFGSQLHRSDYVEDVSATPVVMPKDMSGGRIDTSSIARIGAGDVDRLSGHVLREADIVLARRGDIGRRAWVGDGEAGWLCGTGSMRIRLGDPARLRPRYLYYYLGTEPAIRWLEGHAVGATMSNLSASVVEKLPVPLPPSDVQDRIVSILDSMESLIENNRRQVEILEGMARLIYREWFVHFRFPGHEDVELIESDLGPIPAGWSVVPFSDLADFVNGFAFKPAHWGDEGLPIVKIKELKNGVTADTPRYHGEDIKEKYFVEDGDLLFSWSAHLDAYIWSHGPALLNQHLFVVRPYDLSQLFVFHSLKGRMEDFRARAQGTTMHHIKRSALREVSTVVPDDEIRKSFERAVAPMLQCQLNLVAQNRVLREARELLLPRLVSGELDVSELELELVEVG